MENQTIEEFLLQDSENILRLPYKYKEWTVYPLSMAQVVKIQPYVAKITKADLDLSEEYIKSAKISDFIELLGKYGEDVMFIVNTIVGEDISEKATPDDYMALILGTLYRMGKTSFLKSINLIQRLSLQTRAGLIAAEKRYVTSMTSTKLS